MSLVGETLRLELGNPGHGGFFVARHDGRVVFTRHGLPGETVVARVTEDRGGSFCRADAVEILEPSPDRVAPLCPVSGPGGAGCCDFSHATLPAQRAIKSAVVAEQLRRIAGLEWDVEVEELPRTGNGSGWRTRLRLAVDRDGKAGVHGYRSSEVIADLRCPQPVSGVTEGLSDRRWKPGIELALAVDSTGARHVVEVGPSQVSKARKLDRGRRGATARRAAASAPRPERVAIGSGRVVERVGERTWELAATGFWQAHRTAAQTYSAVVAEWADAAPGSTVWDLYAGVGVFAAALAEQVGATGKVAGVEFSRHAVRDGAVALADLPQVQLIADDVERAIASLPGSPSVVVADPPRSGAGRGVVEAVASHGPARIVHIGCDPAAFARDVALYIANGYRLEQLRAFDAFPLTHHVECIGLLVR